MQGLLVKQHQNATVATAEAMSARGVVHPNQEVAMSTTWEKFQGATLSLARSGSLKDRLTDAYRNHLSAVAEEELPREIREQFHNVRCSLTRERPQRGEDAIRATVRKMSSHEAENIAETVVQMLSVMARSPQSTRTAAPAPLYLLEA
jgi:hypothetical protein